MFYCYCSIYANVERKKMLNYSSFLCYITRCYWYWCFNFVLSVIVLYWLYWMNVYYPGLSRRGEGISSTPRTDYSLGKQMFTASGPTWDFRLLPSFARRIVAGSRGTSSALQKYLFDQKTWIFWCHHAWRCQKWFVLEIGTRWIWARWKINWQKYWGTVLSKILINKILISFLNEFCNFVIENNVNFEF